MARPKKTEKVLDESKAKVYYSTIANQAFVLVLKDENGEPIASKDRQGNIRYIGNEPVILSRSIKFDCINSNPSKGCLSIYRTSDPNEIAALDDMVDDEGSSVMSEEQYQRSRNREAFEKGLEVENLKQTNASKDALIADLQSQLAKAEGRAK